ncbi:MAG TPA: FGGY family carbohydrate kinase, partial [Phycisphaerales bacterium]|nr:FGGY family carbohydrate kinase [Phycisphaerales bacterium]
MGLVVAIDQGTTGTRVAVFDADGSVRGFAYREFAQHFPKPGWVEHDAEEIWRSVAELLPAALKKARVGAGDVRGIGITNQRETVVLWDRTSGRPVGRALVWQDRRTTPECKALRARGLEDHVRRTTGLTIDPYFSATKIAWVLRNVPGAAALAARGELAAGTIDSWVIYNLTGGARGGAHVTEVSNASRTMLYDIHRARWDPELLGALDIPEDILPEVRASSEVYAQAGVAD